MNKTIELSVLEIQELISALAVAGDQYSRDAALCTKNGDMRMAAMQAKCASDLDTISNKLATALA